MVKPISNDLVIFINSRHASAVAAIMYHEGLIEYEDGKPIFLRKIKK